MRVPQLTSQFIIFTLLSTMVVPNITRAAELEVPFTSQAPERVWREPWLNACEETSIAMVHAYYTGQTFNLPTAKSAILEVFRLKQKYFGYSFDESTHTVATLIENFYPWNAWVQENPTLDQLKKQLDLGQPVIIPVYGKGLHNPHFLHGGPLYHMLVLSGYNEETQQFIAKEPGTRFGNNYPYPYTTIMNALHDYVLGKDIRFTKPVVIFTSPNTVKPSLVKTAQSPKVYLIQNTERKHIVNEQVFLSHGWKWENIVTVGEPFLRGIPEHEALTE